MKPPGLRVGREGSLHVIRSTRTEDNVWEAVSEAVAEGWTVEQFRTECEQAWAEALRQQAEDAAREWSK